MKMHLISYSIACLSVLSMTTVFTLAEERISLVPSDLQRTVMVGKSTFVQCTTKGHNVQRVIWTGPENNQITSYSARVRVEDSKLGHRGAELHFSDIKMKDAGGYTCSAHVDGHDVSKSFTLKVEKAPDFTDTPSEQYIEEGSDSVIVCNVEGYPEPQIGWMKEGKYLFSNPKYGRDESNSNWLMVKGVTREDGGNYVCSAKQISETTTNFEQFQINVIVHHKPLKFPEKTQESVSYLKGVVNLTCDAVAEPMANFTWMKDDDVIVPSEDVRIFNESHKSILQLSVTKSSMFGDYICIAENHLGKLERVVPLQEGHKPASPKAKVIHTDLNSFKVSLSAPNHPEEPIKGYRVEYKLAGQEWHNAIVKDFSAGQKEYTLDGLDSDKLYVMRTFSLNEAGLSDPSDDTFTRTLKVQAPTSSADAQTAAFSLTFLILFFYNIFTVPLLNVKFV